MTPRLSNGLNLIGNKSKLHSIAQSSAQSPTALNSLAGLMSPASGQMGEAEQQSYLSSGHARQRTLQKMPQSPSGGDPQSSS